MKYSTHPNNTVRILLEAERLRNPYSGLGQFCLHLGKKMVEITENQANTKISFYLPKAQKGVFGENADYIEVNKFHKYFPVRQTFDIWHCLHQDSEYLPSNSKTKLVLTVHDLNFLENEHYPAWKKRWKLSNLQKKINRSAAVTFISEYTASVVRAHLNMSNKPLQKVIYNGNNANIPAEKPQKPKIAENKRFVFSIGIHPKKNYHVLLPILKANKDLFWVIAGADSRDYRDFIQQKAAEIGVSTQLIFTGQISETEKTAYLYHCEALLFPSLAEGFGLPIVEAMSFGKPVFCSNLTSLPEIGGQEAFYFEHFEPEHVNAIYQKGMEAYRIDPEKCERLKKQAAQFTWEASAGSYFNLYQQILEKN